MDNCPMFVLPVYPPQDSTYTQSSFSWTYLMDQCWQTRAGNCKSKPVLVNHYQYLQIRAIIGKSVPLVLVNQRHYWQIRDIIAKLKPVMVNLCHYWTTRATGIGKSTPLLANQRDYCQIKTSNGKSQPVLANQCHRYW